MGKIRTRILGLEEIEEKQKKEQKERASQKKAVKKKETQLEKKPAQTQPEPKEEKKEEVKTKKIKKIRARGRNYQQAKAKINKKTNYDLNEAVKLLKQIKYTNFNESVELHIEVDKKGLKGEVEMPFSTGKTVRVKVVDDQVLQEIEKGKLDFDVLVAHPSYMPKIARFAKILGPKGLMPNPKAGTVTADPQKVVEKFKKGTLHWKTEPKFPLIHLMIGKLSAKDEELVANAQAVLNSVGRSHLIRVFIKSTMSPSISIKY